MKVSIAIHSELIVTPKDLALLIEIMGRAEVASHKYDSTPAHFGKKEPSYFVNPFTKEEEDTYRAAEAAGLTHTAYVQQELEANE